MLKIVSRLILLIKGWTYNVDALNAIDKCVLIVAPHTSAWDMAIGKSVFVLTKIPAKIAVKKEAFFWPMNWILRYLGAIPIDRTPKGTDSKHKLSLVDAIANSIKKEKRICMVITPEGSRGKRKQWKTGFYHIALNAQVPIALGYLDFDVKEAIVEIQGLIQPPNCFLLPPNQRLNLSLIQQVCRFQKWESRRHDNRH